ncbi:MAG: hypothetical protein FWF07_04880, partial [Methanomassiliicoccaceae archaeon]|nr:hypothetical protein [Methanomassiliicoccaceae archaeon]
MSNKGKMLAVVLIVAALCVCAIPFLATNNGSGAGAAPNSGELVLANDLGNYASYKEITGGYPTEAVQTIGDDGLPTWDDTTYAHSLIAALGQIGGDSSATWYQYNTMDFTSNSSYTFALVHGSELTQVGEYTITWNGDTSFTVTFNDQMEAVGGSLSISNDITATPTSDSAYNDNNIWSASPDSQQFEFCGSSFTFDAPWLTDMSNVNVYLHLAGLKGYENTYGVPDDATFAVSVTGPSYPDGTIVSVPVNGHIKLSDLMPGNYTVQEVQDGWTATFTVETPSNGAPSVAPSVTVSVSDGNTTTVRMAYEPSNSVFGTLWVKKLVENSDGTYSAGAGVEFAAYAGVDNDGNPIGEPIETAVTSSTGMAVFQATDAFVSGTTYYVFEVQPLDQNLYQPKDAYIEVTAVSADTPLDVEQAGLFYNDLIPAGFTIDKKVVVTPDKTDNAVIPGEGFTFAAYAKINSDGTPDLSTFIESQTTDSNGVATFGPSILF